MNTIKSILIDDEQLSLDVLRWELERLKTEIDIIGSYTDPKEGRAAIMQHRPDLIFLDIEMPGMDGFQLIQSFDTVFFNVVFTTAYENYAVDAIKQEALDYLLKPVQVEELRRAINRHRSRNIDQLQKHLTSLFNKIQAQNNRSQKIVIPTADGLEFVLLNDILRCESSSNYCYIFLRDGGQIFVSKTLKEIEDLITSEQFFRVHKSHLINLNAVKRYRKADGGSIIMEDGSSVPVSRNKKGDFFDQL